MPLEAADKCPRTQERHTCSMMVLGKVNILYTFLMINTQLLRWQFKVKPGSNETDNPALMSRNWQYLELRSMAVVAMVTANWCNVCLNFRIFVKFINLFWLHTAMVRPKWPCRLVGLVTFVGLCRFGTCTIGMQGLTMQQVLANCAMEILVTWWGSICCDPRVFQALCRSATSIRIQNKKLADEVLG